MNARYFQGMIELAWKNYTFLSLKIYYNFKNDIYGSFMKKLMEVNYNKNLIYSISNRSMSCGQTFKFKYNFSLTHMYHNITLF